MIILLPNNVNYAMDSDFPILSLPLDMPDKVEIELEDFQWWAKSDDFDKWLSQNKREWVADSEDYTAYYSIEELIKENNGMQPSMDDIIEHVKLEASKVIDNIDDYRIILEKEENNEDPDVIDPEMEKKIIKLHFTYNNLKKDGKLNENYIIAEQKFHEVSTIFLTPKDPNTGESIEEALDAYRIFPIKTSENSKFKLFSLWDSQLQGVLKTGVDTDKDIADKAINTGIKVVIGGLTGITLFTLGKYALSTFLLRKSINIILGKRNVRKVNKRILNIIKKIFSKSGVGIKTLYGKIKIPAGIFIKRTGKGLGMMATGKNIRGVSSAIKRALRSSSKAYKFGNVGIKGALKAFGKAATRGLTRTGTKFIPFVGEVLMLIELVGSIWHWNKNNQAPKYSEVKEFAKDKFQASKIPFGVPIYVCWSQPAGGNLGNAALDFFVNKETRTTMQLVRVGETKGKTIFILIQINSKEIQEKIAKSDMTLVAFDSDKVFDRGLFDNDNLTFDMSSIATNSGSVFIHKGNCKYSDYKAEYNKSPEKLITLDESLPDKFEFHFEDLDKNKINIIGEKIKKEDLDNYSDEKLMEMFSLDLTKEKDEDSKVATFNINENILNNNYDQLYETAEKDDSDESELELTIEQKSSPLKLGIYIVRDKYYANPDLGKKYKKPRFTNFIVKPEDVHASEGDFIEIEVNTDEILINSKKGLYKYNKQDEEIDIKNSKNFSQSDDDIYDNNEEDTKRNRKENTNDIKINNKEIKDDYFIQTDPTDIEIKSDKKSTTINDKSVKGGTNLYDKLLSDREKEVLKIEDWKTITSAEESRDKRGDVIKIKFNNKYAPFGNKSRSYRIEDGESFEIAKKYIERAKKRIKYY